MKIFWAIRRFVVNNLTPHEIRRHTRWFWQRQIRGWDDRETWSLDRSTARFLAPRLEVLRDRLCGYPPIFDGHDYEIWFAILDKMAQTFRFICDEKDFEGWVGHADDYVSEGLDLFCEYYFHLWD